MLSHLCHRRYGVPEGELLEFDNLHRLDPRIPRVFFTHDLPWDPWNRWWRRPLRREHQEKRSGRHARSRRR